MVKGFALDDDRLKQGKTAFGKDYFRELLERVRSIRASERRIWQQITDIFAECSLDYDRNARITRDFYAMVQNKFHYAIIGKTAAELIHDGADRAKENMGLKTWKNAPDGRILKSDVSVAKNYLDEKQIRQLERMVSGYFDYIEDLIERENTFTMEQFAASINEFLTFRKYEILPGKGSVSALTARERAEKEYDIFKKTQKVIAILFFVFIFLLYRNSCKQALVTYAYYEAIKKLEEDRNKHIEPPKKDMDSKVTQHSKPAEETITMNRYYKKAIIKIFETYCQNITSK